MAGMKMEKSGWCEIYCEDQIRETSWERGLGEWKGGVGGSSGSRMCVGGRTLYWGGGGGSKLLGRRQESPAADRSCLSCQWNVQEEILIGRWDNGPALPKMATSVIRASSCVDGTRGSPEESAQIRKGRWLERPVSRGGGFSMTTRPSLQAPQL